MRNQRFCSVTYLPPLIQGIFSMKNKNNYLYEIIIGTK